MSHIRRLTILVAVATALLVAPSVASAGFRFGTGFHIGGFHFKLGFRAPDHDYYYYTQHQLHSPRYRCTDRCYFDSGAYYHHAACPVVHDHFHRHGYYAKHVFERYAPRHAYDPYYSYDDHHGRGHHYDRGHRHRYSRRDSGYYYYHRRDGYRYDRRGRHPDRHDRDRDRRRHRHDDDD